MIDAQWSEDSGRRRQAEVARASEEAAPKSHGTTSDCGKGTLASTEVTQTEVRLALVMNGGVSLAVWMGGVTHEIDLLRRASCCDSPEDVDERDRDVFNIWRKLAGDARKRFRVDVISGTSAGGLNGLLLATTIGRGARMADIRGMWEDSASLDSLLPGMGERGLLGGASFKQRIDKALAGIKKNPSNQRGADPAGVDSSDETITLFLTATALGGRRRVATDGYGKHFEIDDHRRLYRFKNQTPGCRYVKESDIWKFDDMALRHFSPDNEAALSLAGRATASFPGAFSPVNERELMEHRIYPDPVYGDPASCVMDGGVLNNAPFGPVLDEITKRRVQRRPVDRVLVYVVPSVGRSADQRVRYWECSQSPTLETFIEAVLRPQEADFRSGAEDLHGRLKNAVLGTREELFQRLIEDSYKERNNGREPANRIYDESAALLLDDYRRSRVRAVMLDVINQCINPSTQTIFAAPDDLNEQEIDEILGRDLPWFPSNDRKLLSHPDLKGWSWGLVTAERVLQTFGHHLGDVLRPHHAPAPFLRSDQRKLVEESASVISDCLRRLLALTDAVKTELKRRANSGEGKCEQRAARLLTEVFEELNVRETAGELVDGAAKCFVQALGNCDSATYWINGDQAVSACLTAEVLTQAFAPPARVIERLTPKFRFLRLGPDSMGPLFHEDRLADLGAQKLYGTHFRHFGAFVDRGWRQSDFAWGRLDAAHHLLPMLLPDDDGRQEKELHRAILDAEKKSPGAGADPRSPAVNVEEQMRRRLDSICNGDCAPLDFGQRKSLETNTQTLLQAKMPGWLPPIISGLIAWLLARRFWSVAFREQQARISGRRRGQAVKSELIRIAATGVALPLTVGILVGALAVFLLIIFL
ncbi:DUF3376 domain-containing protein [Frankia umida]|nr:DUF3376 domain-containing protein [Frankia umida]